MSDLADLAFRSNEFSGRARLFPLPNLVLFPHVMQPLHIFEPRYRAMFEEAVADDRLIALSLLAPGWEKNYEGRPPIEPVACLGRVATFHRVGEDRYNLLLLGLRRVKIVRELPPDKPFREAEVEVWEDVYPTPGTSNRSALLRELVRAFQVMLPQAAESVEKLDQHSGNHLPLGMLTDIVAYTLQLDAAQKYSLLSEQDVDRRAELLLAHLANAAKQSGRVEPFPPDFSAN